MIENIEGKKAISEQKITVSASNRDFWPFVSGLLLGFLVALFVCASSVVKMNKEHNEKYHTEEYAND